MKRWRRTQSDFGLTESRSEHHLRGRRHPLGGRGLAKLAVPRAHRCPLPGSAPRLESNRGKGSEKGLVTMANTFKPKPADSKRRPRGRRYISVQCCLDGSPVFNEHACARVPWRKAL